MAIEAAVEVAETRGVEPDPLLVDGVLNLAEPGPDRREDVRDGGQPEPILGVGDFGEVLSEQRRAAGAVAGRRVAVVEHDAVEAPLAEGDGDDLFQVRLEPRGVDAGPQR